MIEGLLLVSMVMRTRLLGARKVVLLQTNNVRISKLHQRDFFFFEVYSYTRTDRSFNRQHLMHSVRHSYLSFTPVDIEVAEHISRSSKKFEEEESQDKTEEK